ncbi:MAG: site-specific integrase [Oscillospiraceae bacterium]|nr:site-specific integrase [Oscillospiraceae bacterium]
MNIYLRKDGRYEARVPNGKRADGKRMFKYVFARTKEQCIERVRAIHQQARLQGHCALTFAELYSEWHHSILHRVKESTAANYAMKSEKHILPALGDKVVSNVTAEHIYDFIESKQKEGFSPRYIADIVILIKSVFKYAVRTYQIYDPVAGIVLPKKRPPVIQLLDEVEQKSLQQYIGGNQNRSTLGTALSMTTGIRIGELCALQWRDIDLKKRILTVTKTIQRIQCPSASGRTKVVITDPKSISSRRQIPIPDCMIGFLQRFRGRSEEYVLTGTERPIEPRAMQYRFQTILKNARLPSVHFHALRHIFATNCIKLGFDVKALSELLGHSSVEITLNRYVHSSFDQKREYMKRVQMTF